MSGTFCLFKGTPVFLLILFAITLPRILGPDSTQKIEKFIHWEIAKNFGGSLEEVKERLGEALHTAAKKTENIHVRGVEETVLRVQYPGITFIFVQANELHREFLAGAELTGQDYVLSWGVRIGISRKNLAKIFGEPKRRLDNNSVYRYTDSESLNLVDFYFEGETLTKILWIFYID